MFPDEEGKLQNRIENLWIAVDDKQKSAVRRATLLFNRIASYVTRVYNRILGTSLISFQMIGVSSASSIAAFFLFAALALFFLLYLSLSRHVAVAPHFNSSLFLIGVVCLIFGFIPLVFAFIPSFIRNWFGRLISLVPLLLFTYVMSSSILTNQSASKYTQETVISGLYLGIATDIGALAAVRMSVRLIATTTRIGQIIFAVILQLAVLVLIAVVPFEVPTPLLAANQHSFGAQFLLSSMMFNFFTMLGVAAFLLLLTVVLVHRAFWPLLGRLVYSIARFKPIQNNRLAFAVVGLVCMLYGIGFLNWHSVVVWFEGHFNPLK